MGFGHLGWEDHETVGGVRVDGHLHRGAPHRQAEPLSLLGYRTLAGIDLSPHRQPEAPLPPPPGSIDRPLAFNPRADMPEGFPHVVEFDRVVGSFREGSPSKTWVRLLVPFVRGEETSPLVRLMALADFTSGLGSFLPMTSSCRSTPT